MKKTTVLCDICGEAYTYPGLIDFRAFSGELVRVFLVAKNKELHESVQMDICQHCARKIEKFLENMEREEDGNG